MTTQPIRVCSIGAELGEGPVWVPQEAALWFVDIAGGRVHRYQPTGDRHAVWAAPAKPSFILPIRGGGFLVGLKSGLHRFDPSSGGFTHVADPEPHLPDNRLNDGCVSPEGDLWFGSMHDPETEASGVLYRFDAAGRATAVDSGYVVTNGPAFSPDGRTFYHTDSYGRTVYAFDRAEGGGLARKRVLMQIEQGAGYPDGTTVDSEGCLWVALWAGWGMRRYSPGGELLETVRFPCANVTKVAFGGEDRRTAYATTAWKGLSAAERAAQPMAGDLFSFRTDVAGAPLTPLSLAA